MYGCCLPHAHTHTHTRTHAHTSTAWLLPPLLPVWCMLFIWPGWPLKSNAVWILRGRGGVGRDVLVVAL